MPEIPGPITLSQCLGTLIAQPLESSAKKLRTPWARVCILLDRAAFLVASFMIAGRFLIPDACAHEAPLVFFTSRAEVFLPRPLLVRWLAGPAGEWLWVPDRPVVVLAERLAWALLTFVCFSGDACFELSSATIF